MRLPFLVVALVLSGFTSAFAQQGKPTVATGTTPSPDAYTAGLTDLVDQLQELSRKPASAVNVAAAPSLFERYHARAFESSWPTAKPGMLQQRGNVRRVSPVGEPVRINAQASVDASRLRALRVEDAVEQHLQRLALPGLQRPAKELHLTVETTDAFNTRHLRLQQTYRGIPVYGGELILHQPLNSAPTATGRLFPTAKLERLTPSLAATDALEAARSYGVNPATGPHKGQPSDWMRHLHDKHPDEASLMVVYWEGVARLAYVTDTRPHLGEHFVSFVDAHSGEVFDRYSLRCDLVHEFDAAAEALPPRTANARDLNGLNRSLNVFEAPGNGFFMIDATRPMFSSSGSVPGGEEGALVTANAQGESPQSNNFSPVYANSSNNSWTNAAEVSAHFNTAESYAYFAQTFGRNSLDGSGGTITAFVNVSDENGSAMDNAFYSNGLMFYGNGRSDFTNLAGALDVGGHEMSHGVIEFTANLEYRNESGALNEHFADAFAVMIDRDDWLLGEDIVRSSFPSGALRNMADPRNGGNSLSDRGYQPPTYGERYTGTQDFGGVHINSGIANRVFFLFAEAQGRSKAEQLWYNALSNYLTRTSDFEDFRYALQQAAQQQFGQNSAELTDVVAALDAQGIPGTSSTGGGGPSGPTTQQTNPGTPLVAFSDDAENLVRVARLDASTLISDITPSARPGARVSISDDGSVALLATSDGNLNVISIDYTTNTVSDNVLNGDLNNDGTGDIRNAALSRDGSRIALVTNDFDPRIYIIDNTLDDSRTFELYTPGSNGERIFTVDYADAMEWDYSGNFLLFDMRNTVNGSGGFSVSNWDIGVLNTHNANGQFSTGDIFKLFSNLSPGVSIGNMTLAKNSENIMAFDYFDDDDRYEVRAIDLETGNGSTLWAQDRLGWPSFTASDRELLFDAANQTGSPVIAFVVLGADKVTNPTGDGLIFIDNARKAFAYANGARDLVSTITELSSGAAWTIGPNPSSGMLRLFRRAEAVLPKGDVEVFDLQGKRVAAFVKTSRELDLSSFPAGMYEVRWGTTVKTIVLE